MTPFKRQSKSHHDTESSIRLLGVLSHQAARQQQEETKAGRSHRYRLLTRRAIKTSVFLGLFLALQYSSSIHDYRRILNKLLGTNRKKKIVRGTKDASLKYILYYTRYFGREDFDWGQGRQPFAHCPVSACYATSNSYDVQSISDFDAFIYHAHQDGWIEHPGSIRTWRQPHHRFILFGQESPSNRPVVPGHNRERLREEWPYGNGEYTDAAGYNFATIDPYDSFFNWTMTHRWDSDIPFPYGWFQELNNTEYTAKNNGDPLLSLTRLEPYLPDHWKQFNASAFRERLAQKQHDLLHLAQRPKKVAWTVSNCGSFTKREKYVQELSRYIPVDIFGGCGNFSCSLSYDEMNRITGELDNCTATVRSDYKFYLAFENSFCDDYVTEKFFSNMDTNVVLVMGQANYSRIAPPRSYIDIFDYPSPKALAEYLHHLDRNDVEYLSYFWWQDFYRVIYLQSSPKNVLGQRAHRSGLCRICERLHHGDDNDISSSQQAQTYHNLAEWYQGPKDKAVCGRRLPDLHKQLEMH